MQMEQFKAGLTERDKIILQMRAEKYTLQEIADKVGYQTPSAVKKHLEQITGSYENFIREEYSTFLDEHTK
jgi:DNA-binding NarL/FixJ family response regulator